MNTPSSQPAAAPSFFNRVLNNESTRRGLAGAAAGLLVSVVVEAIWPSTFPS
jgi:hypothetical protein